MHSAVDEDILIDFIRQWLLSDKPTNAAHTLFFFFRIHQCTLHISSPEIPFSKWNWSVLLRLKKWKVHSCIYRPWKKVASTNSLLQLQCSIQLMDSATFLANIKGDSQKKKQGGIDILSNRIWATELHCVYHFDFGTTYARLKYSSDLLILLPACPLRCLSRGI